MYTVHVEKRGRENYARWKVPCGDRLLIADAMAHAMTEPSVTQDGTAEVFDGNLSVIRYNVCEGKRD